MIILNFCPVCYSEKIEQKHIVANKPFIEYEIMPGVKIDTGIINVYWLCQNCKVLFQNPRFSDIELDEYYSKGYYRKSLIETDKDMDIGESHRAKFDAGIIKKHIGQINSHLDVGAGCGYLLSEVGAKHKVAVELDKSRIRVKGLKVYPQIQKVPNKLFDLVTAIHVLEHVSNPVGYLNDMIKLVSKNGHFVIEVPTWNSPGGPLRLAHLFHFETEVLSLMCRRAGLRIVETKLTPHLLLICKVTF